MKIKYLSLACLLLLSFCPSLAAQDLAPPRINRIRVVVNEVFATNSNFLFDLANALHCTSAHSVILSELLYSEGDEYDQDLIDESERNLRKLNLFVVEKTRVLPLADQVGLVDIELEVRDIWSMYFNFKLESSGGMTRYNFKWGERNFLGRALSLELELDRDNFFNRWRQHFDEPRLFGSRWRFFERVGLYYGHDGERVGEGIELYLIRPLFARSEKWGWQTSFLYENDFIIKNEGEKIKEIEVAPGVRLPRKYHQEKLILENRLTRSFGYENKLNLGFFIRNEARAYQGYQGLPEEYANEFRALVMKDDYTRHKLGIALDADNLRYIRIKNYQTFGRIEDLALGFLLETSLAVSTRFWGSDENALYPEISLSHTAILGENQISLASLSFGSAFGAGFGQRNMVFGLSYRHHFRGLPLGTLALRLGAQFGERLDNDNVLSLGADSGLRGYVANRFEGDRKLIFNIEYRFDPLPFIQNPWIGFVAFYDLGACWFNHERRLAEVKFYPALGLGLRLSIPSLNPALMRFDFGFNLGNDSTSFASIFTFGYEQAF